VCRSGNFYEGAIKAAGSFPSDATDQLVQFNIVEELTSSMKARSSLINPGSITETKQHFG
jgi:hypothetical protein